jgi:hypothetical protein
MKDSVQGVEPISTVESYRLSAFFGKRLPARQKKPPWMGEDAPLAARIILLDKKKS